MNKAYQSVKTEHPRASVAIFVVNPENLEEILIGDRFLKTSIEGISEICVPGGKVDWFETVEFAAIREVKEETGLDIKIRKYIGYSDEMWLDNNIHFVCHYFIADVIGGIVTETEPTKQGNWRWVNVLPVPKFFGNATKVLINNLLEFSN